MPAPRTSATQPGNRVLLAAGLVVVLIGLGLLTFALLHRTTAGAGARPVASGTPVDQSAVDASTYANQLRAAANDARAADGLPRFAVADCAAPVALARATALLGRPLEHAALDPVRAACPGSDVVAENLSRAEALPVDVVHAWMASPGHRANLLDPTLTAMVVACTHDGAQMLCSQLFTGSTATPAS